MKNFNIGYFSVSFILLTLLLTLVNTDYFYHKTLFSYYGFVVGTSILAILIGLSVLTKAPLVNSIKLPILIFGLWAVYVFINSYLLKAYSTFPNYILFSFLLFLSLNWLFSNTKGLIKTLIKGILIIAVAQAVYCLLQYFNFFKSNNQFFEITGTWVNPNVTAMFMAMCFPLFFVFLSKKHKKPIILSLSLIIIALILLKCRTALLGVMVTALSFYIQKLKIAVFLKQAKNRTSVFLMAVVCLGIIIPVANYLYTQKKDSADGRKIIWNLSAEMIKEKPLLGYGYGTFGKNYNTYQANAVEQAVVVKDAKLLGPVRMAYNELLQNGVEGGILGVAIFIFFIGSVLYFPKYRSRLHVKDDEDLAIDYAFYAGVVGFAMMSLVNFSVQAIPVWLLFIIYSAFITTKMASINFTGPHFLQKIETKYYRYLTGTVGIFLGVYMGYGTTCVAQADRQNKLSVIQAQNGDLNGALKKLPALQKNLYFYESYWINYGDLLLKAKNYNQAISKFKEAKKLSSEPQIFIKSGICYQKMGKYSAAILEFKQAVLLDPNKFLNRHLLLTAFQKSGDSNNAAQVAKDIIDLKPKILSTQVNQYKKYANEYLRTLNINYSRKPYITL